MKHLWGKMLNRARKDERGIAAIEMALALPVLVIMLNTVVNVSFILWEQASLNNAVGQASRLTTLYPSPDEAAVIARAEASVIGRSGNVEREVIVEEGTNDGRAYVEVTMTAQMPIDFIFIEGPTLNLSQTRRTYVTSPLAT